MNRAADILLPREIIVQIARVAPWGAFNALRRVATWMVGSGNIDSHIVVEPVATEISFITIERLPNGILHGVSTFESIPFLAEVEYDRGYRTILRQHGASMDARGMCMIYVFDPDILFMFYKFGIIMFAGDAYSLTKPDRIDIPTPRSARDELIAFSTRQRFVPNSPEIISILDQIFDNDNGQVKLLAKYFAIAGHIDRPTGRPN